MKKNNMLFSLKEKDEYNRMLTFFKYQILSKVISQKKFKNGESEIKTRRKKQIFYYFDFSFFFKEKKLKHKKILTLKGVPLCIFEVFHMLQSFLISNLYWNLFLPAIFFELKSLLKVKFPPPVFSDIFNNPLKMKKKHKMTIDNFLYLVSNNLWKKKLQTREFLSFLSIMPHEISPNSFFFHLKNNTLNDTYFLMEFSGKSYIRGRKQVYFKKTEKSILRKFIALFEFSLNF